MAQDSGYLQLRDRACALLSTSEPLTDEALLAYVYGGAPPAALRARLIAPLLDDPRLERTTDGRWTVARRAAAAPVSAEFTALALTTTGPHPARARVLRVAALHVVDGVVVERFSATVNPTRRVPGYVAQRAGLAPDTLDELPPFVSIVADLERFLDRRPICAQEARHAWQFLCSEARRVGRALREPLLVDVNELADLVLGLDAKPTLALVAQRLGIAFTRIEQADEEARVVSLVMPPLVQRAQQQGVSTGSGISRGALHRPATARDLPDRPGIYVMRDAAQSAVYIGKARRLRTRVAAYVHRPLGATRRLEGLATTVQAVDTQECQTDLEALILEDREIRRLQPRFNTQRQQRAVRLWIRLPPWPTRARLAAPRLELVSGPDVGAGSYLGPFRNEAAAEYARGLARAVFGLNDLRRSADPRYVEQLAGAWAFLNGQPGHALDIARHQHAQAVGAHDARAARSWGLCLARVRDYDPAALLLPVDPRDARYAVVRLGPLGVEAFVLERAILLGWAVLDVDDADVHGFAVGVLDQHEPRTTGAEIDVVLRWFGAQRLPSARLVALPSDCLAAADAIEAAVAALLALV
jgi:DNA polymerase III epsilon subunit-like protein